MAKVMSIDLRRDELNARFGGGIPKNTMMLIEAPNAVGKSILAQRICYGLLHNGSTVTYVSTELSLSGFVNQMGSLDYKVEDKLLKNDLLFISIFPYVGKVEIGEDFFNKLSKSNDLFSKQAFILDSFSNIILKENMTVPDFFEAIHSFKRASMDKSIILCVDPEELDEKFLKILRTLTDIYLKLEVKDVYGVTVTSLNIIRFQGAGNDITPSTPFKVRAGVGIIVESAG